jgi:hypothetical protein
MKRRIVAKLGGRRDELERGRADDVVRRSRTAVSAAGRMGHSSSNPSTLIQAVMSSIASTSAASRASHGVPASRCFSSVRRSAEAAASVGVGTMEIGQRRHELVRHEQADVLEQHRPARFEHRHEVVIPRNASEGDGRVDQRSRPRLQMHAAASDASWGVNGRD